MHPVGFVGVAIVVLVQNACKPMRTPSVFREDRSPIPFVLVGQQQLEFRSKTLPFGRFPLRFQHVDIGINHALEGCGDRGGQGVEFQVVKGVFPLEGLRDFAANLHVEIPNKLRGPKAPRLSFIAVDDAF